MRIRSIPVDAVDERAVYLQIADRLKATIERRRPAPGTQLPHLAEIARAAGVSLRTADRAVNELLRQGLCFRRPKKGTFIGKPRTGRRRNMVAILHSWSTRPDQLNVLQARLYRGALAEADRRRADLLFVQRPAAESVAAYASSPGLNLKGVLLLNWLDLEAAVALANQFPETRFVCVNHDLPGFDGTPANLLGVFNDDAGGARRMTEHLLSQGRRHIALFTIDVRSRNYRRREEGYARALADAGVARDETLTVRFDRQPGPSQVKVARAAARKLSERAGDIDAVFCANDHLAEGVLDHVEATGQRERILVTGYDALHEAISRERKFSTVAIDYEGLGARAVALLTAKTARSAKTIRVKPQLIVRGH